MPQCIFLHCRRLCEHQLLFLRDNHRFRANVVDVYIMQSVQLPFFDLGMKGDACLTSYSAAGLHMLAADV